jgi:hypothetical protein
MATNHSPLLAGVVCWLSVAVAAASGGQGHVDAPPPPQPTQGQAAGRGTGDATSHPQAGVTEAMAAATASFRIDGDSEPLAIRGPAFGGDDALYLRETTGREVTVRATPVDEQGAPVDGGRVIVLKPSETRTVHLTETLPPEDLIDRRLSVERIAGTGRAELNASWLTAQEIEAAGARLHVPRRELSGVPSPTSEELINQAEAKGTIDHETALVYRTFALFGDARLPAQYRGSDVGDSDSLELDEVLAALPTMSATNQALVQPFLTPPAYQGSWASGPASARLPVPEVQPSCNPFARDWSWFEHPGGLVRVWFRISSDATTAQAILDAVEGVIWPKLAALMTGHVPLFGDGELCNGGNLTIDIYLVESADFPGITIPYHAGGAPTPAYIEIKRGSNLKTTLSIVAHELFHAFQFSYQLRSDLMSSDYDWWSEASATWAEDYVYPTANLEQSWASVFLAHPEKPLDYVDASSQREYGAYLVPFYVYHKTGSAAFVATSWANCAGEPAVQALDAALPGGFAAIWPEVALHNWNQKPVDQYKTRRGTASRRRHRRSRSRRR